VVGVLGVQVVGTVPHSEPTQAGVPATQLWTLVVASARHEDVLPQLCVQLWFVSQPGQQLITWPQPSEAKPQLWPSSAQVFGVHVVCATPQVFATPLAPQNSWPVQDTPPLAALHW
jgi:hypothetical protein